MGDTTGIAWTEKTWNPWQGCRKVSAGCRNCYMFAEKKRYGQDPATVVRSKPPTFNAPRKWADPALVFTCSWSDFFIEEADAWRPEAWEIIRATPHLTYQILTKRPERIAKCLPADWGDGYLNVWMGVSVENQAAAYDRIPSLLETPAAVRFLSCEPLLEPVTIDPPCPGLCSHEHCGPSRWEGLHWVIVGGESGRGARPCDVAWVRSLVEQCRDAGAACFVKQLGAVPATAIDVTGQFRTDPATGRRQIQMKVTTLPLRDRKGGDPAEWPADLQVREMPEGSR